MFSKLLSSRIAKLRINQYTQKLFGRPFFATKIETLIQDFSKQSFSQSGEDLIVNYIFSLRGIDYPSYIDIGANHPFYLSNTAFFYLKGCRGINVEANPILVKNFIKFRNGDINLNYGVGTIDGLYADFFIMDDPTLSTFSQFEMESFLRTGRYKVTETKKIETYTLQYLLDNYSNGTFPDFMSIDVEGLDFDIIKTIDFNTCKPKIICLESHDYSPIGAGKRRTEMIKYVIEKGYYEYADTGLNSIFVEKSFWFI